MLTWSHKSKNSKGRFPRANGSFDSLVNDRITFGDHSTSTFILIAVLCRADTIRIHKNQEPMIDQRSVKRISSLPNEISSWISIHDSHFGSYRSSLVWSCRWQNQDYVIMTHGHVLRRRRLRTSRVCLRRSSCRSTGATTATTPTRTITTRTTTTTEPTHRTHILSLCPSWTHILR